MRVCFQTGAWGCFDEFNRINIEVLSVVAQQILSILSALSAKATNFIFEGREIRLIQSCGIFITMNPGTVRIVFCCVLQQVCVFCSCVLLLHTHTHCFMSVCLCVLGYAGRTELPDNLKSMFRPISMVVPDSTLIAEITLFGEGFNNCKVMSLSRFRFMLTYYCNDQALS